MTICHDAEALESGPGYLRAAGESIEPMDISIFDWEETDLNEGLYEKAKGNITCAVTVQV